MNKPLNFKPGPDADNKRIDVLNYLKKKYLSRPDPKEPPKA